MKISKTKKEGDSVIITIPAELGVAEGEEFYLQRSNNGTILLVPKIRDYFEDALEGEFRQRLEWENLYTMQGREEVE